MIPEAEDDRIASFAGTIGFVIIGRNEGSRLVASLRSLGPYIGRAVYVDSGSTDGSVATAREMGALVVELSTDVPFTAARARNAGAEALLLDCPAISLVQFLDGDCSLEDGWIDTAAHFLATNAQAAIVCGVRREKCPERSIYNWLCDREWNAPKGQISECGGDFMIRAGDFSVVTGFRPDLIAGEEPEMCVRLREKGRGIWRLDRTMSWHDANITRFAQWWRRQLRAGHAFAEVYWLHRHSQFRIWQRQFLRAIFWGALLPVALVALSVLVGWCFLFLFLVYPLNIARIAAREDLGNFESWKSAFFSVLGKFPEMFGALTFHARRLTGKKHRIIEYK